MPEPIFDELLTTRHSGVFADVMAEDGVTYPRICTDVPRSVIDFLTIEAGQAPKMVFMRESPAGVECPHIVHADHLMGNTAMMIYLDDVPNGGTGFMRHVTLGVNYMPRVPALASLLQADQNKPDMWFNYTTCEARRNRVCFFNAGHFHSALPFGGYGAGTNARCVLTAFWGDWL